MEPIQPDERPAIAAPTAPPPMAPESNGLGLAGFITSLVGLVVTGGLLCPIGLILSLIALSRRPRGFAIAGTVLGAVGSCGSCLVALFVIPLVAGGLLFAAFALVASGGVSGLNTLDHMMQVDRAITQYVHVHHTLPESLSDLNLPADLLEDGWGTPLQYSVTRDGAHEHWTLQSAGSDKQFDADDISFSGDNEAQPEQRPDT
jgi:hypothetical protein